MLRFVRTLFTSLEWLWLLRDCNWADFKRLSWSAKPIRCAYCKGWFMRGDFFNPGKPYKLTCSNDCCVAVRTQDR